MRKQLVLALLLALSSVSLGGCRDNNMNTIAIKHEETNPVQNAKEPVIADMGKITHLAGDNAEYAILKAGGVDTAMVYDLQLGSHKFSEVEAWIDRYDNGEFTNKTGPFTFGIQGAEDSDSQARYDYKLYYTFSTIEDSEQEQVTLALRKNGSVAKAEATQSRKKLPSGITNMWSVEEIIPGETHDLALIAWNKGNGMTTSDVEETIKNNELVYVLRCRFTAAEGSQS
ncbi:hypothetical protein [Paenibacillus tarimensis]|uniref:hypothetical protein n=1 Tax=Paenibacillus tarimensis TaxID=416012 RepID=UPI001F2DA1F9|nr:hypothetical protein [Paenibacillus tarimensis]MCF2946085.1 hypothetical protein [Paenibacillus tarimensis]